MGSRYCSCTAIHARTRRGTAVAPRLADTCFVVCPDLRGYGQSTLPADAPDHAQSSKRAMAQDVVSLMRQLGHDRFAVVGHERGSLWWHWWLFGQTEKPAERVINLDPDAWYRTPSPHQMGEESHADLWAALRDPAVVHGMCEDYRAGLRIDRAHEEADRTAGRRVACPMLLLAATEDDIDIHGDPALIWRSWVAGELRSAPIHSGDHQAELAPDELVRALIPFLEGETTA